MPLVDIRRRRGVYFEDSFTSWRDHVLRAAAIAATLRDRLDPAKPPHVGVLLENTPFFSAMLVAAGMSGDRAGRPQRPVHAAARRWSATSARPTVSWYWPDTELGL